MCRGSSGEPRLRASMLSWRSARPLAPTSAFGSSRQASRASETTCRRRWWRRSPVDSVRAGWPRPSSPSPRLAGPSILPCGFEGAISQSPVRLTRKSDRSSGRYAATLAAAFPGDHRAAIRRTDGRHGCLARSDAPMGSYRGRHSAAARTAATSSRARRPSASRSGAGVRRARARSPRTFPTPTPAA